MIVQCTAYAGGCGYRKTSHLQGKQYPRVWTVLNAPESVTPVKLAAIRIPKVGDMGYQNV